MKTLSFSTNKPAISNPDMVYRKIMELEKEIKWDRENFIVVLLDGENKPINALIEFVGGRNKVTIDQSLVFKNAIINNSTGIVIAHNHPNFNDLSPSKQDEKLTKKLQSGGEILDIEVLDHLIFNKDEYISLKQEGYMK